MSRRPAAIRRIRRYARRGGLGLEGERALPEETPVAFSFNGATHAVMMATPADLADFAIGFALAEGIVGDAGEIEGPAIVLAGGGIDLQMTIPSARADALAHRRRALAGPVGCGLCGAESIDAVQRPIEANATTVTVDPDRIVAAMAALSGRQPMFSETGAVHAAAFMDAGGRLTAVREDVGRHNALDKLAGALARSRIPARSGAILMTSRLSIELVHKAAALRAPVLAAVSAPTAAAVRLAEAAGIALMALVRGADYEIYSRPDRLKRGEDADVA